MGGVYGASKVKLLAATIMAVGIFILLACAATWGIMLWAGPTTPQVVQVVRHPYHLSDIVSLYAIAGTPTATPVTASTIGQLTIHREVADTVRLCLEDVGCVCVGDVRKLAGR